MAGCGPSGLCLGVDLGCSAGPSLASTGGDADGVSSNKTHLLVVHCFRHWNKEHGLHGDTSCAPTPHMEHHGNSKGTGDRGPRNRKTGERAMRKRNGTKPNCHNHSHHGDTTQEKNGVKVSRATLGKSSVKPCPDGPTGPRLNMEVGSSSG